MKPGTVDTAGMAMLAGKPLSVAEREKPTGLLSCPDCTKHRETAFRWERKFWSLSALIVNAIGDRADRQLPGTSLTWGECYTKLTGIGWDEAVRREQERRRVRKAS